MVDHCIGRWYVFDLPSLTGHAMNPRFPAPGQAGLPTTTTKKLGATNTGFSVFFFSLWRRWDTRGGAGQRGTRSISQISWCDNIVSVNDAARNGRRAWRHAIALILRSEPPRARQYTLPFFFLFLLPFLFFPLLFPAKACLTLPSLKHTHRHIRPATHGHTRRHGNEGPLHSPPSLLQRRYVPSSLP